MHPYFFVFDVESIGIHGEGFAVGYVVIGQIGMLEEGKFACNPVLAEGDLDDRGWVAKHVPPIASNCPNMEAVRWAFLNRWLEWKERGAVMIADFGWPVEARFLASMIDLDRHKLKWQGPYPLFDLGSILLAKGQDAHATHGRRPDELPEHDPLCDARQSARLLIENLDPWGAK